MFSNDLHRTDGLIVLDNHTNGEAPPKSLFDFLEVLYFYRRLNTLLKNRGEIISEINGVIVYGNNRFPYVHRL
jgi:hypothetical protein